MRAREVQTEMGRQRDAMREIAREEAVAQVREGR
jgi:hypothetical protein